MIRVLLIVLSLIAAGLGAAVAHAAGPPPAGQLISPELRARSLAILRETLAKESRWIKVHAAEHLLELRHPEGVYEAFEAERATLEQEPKYRIGIWRVLARAATSDPERQKWLDRIRAVVIDPKSTDKIHAIETLAKLDDQLAAPDLKKATIAAAAADLPSAPYARWSLAVAGGATEVKQLAELLDSKNPDVRLVAAYGLERLNVKEPAIRLHLAEIAKREPADAAGRAYLLSAAWSLPVDDRSAKEFRAALLSLADSQAKGARAVASAALARLGDRADVVILENWLADPDPDTRAAVAAALLHIGSPRSTLRK